MLTLDLHRVLDNGVCTRGVLTDTHSGKVLCVTIERPWADNERGVSSIPPGSYKCRPTHVSPTFGARCIAIDDVPNRSHCLFHAANRASELRGCIAPGEKFGELGGEDAVLFSGAALTALLNYVGTDDFMLVVHHTASRTL